MEIDLGSQGREYITVREPAALSELEIRGRQKSTESVGEKITHWRDILNRRALANVESTLPTKPIDTNIPFIRSDGVSFNDDDARLRKDNRDRETEAEETEDWHDFV